MSAAEVPVFLLDENQVVRPGETGGIESIRAYAEAQGLTPFVVELPEQFRCGGGASYVRWVEQLLGLADSDPSTWEGHDRFQVLVADSLSEMEQVLLSMEADGYTARMSAGYCWPWSDPRPDETLVPDVSIGDWARPWNVKGGEARRRSTARLAMGE